MHLFSFLFFLSSFLPSSFPAPFLFNLRGIKGKSTDRWGERDGQSCHLLAYSPNVGNEQVATWGQQWGTHYRSSLWFSAIHLNSHHQAPSVAKRECCNGEVELSIKLKSSDVGSGDLNSWTKHPLPLQTSVLFFL